HDPDPLAFPTRRSSYLFVADSSQTDLITNIYLSARPKFSLNMNFDLTHSNIQQVGTAFSTSVITRNVFGGAETLNISARGAIGLDRKSTRLNSSNVKIS